jgi:uncharacterized protein YggE
MDSMNGSLWQSQRIEKLVAVFLVVASIFVALLAIGSVMRWWAAPAMANNVITVSGEGKATAIPNIATISFTVTGDGTNASQAQDDATKKINTAVALLKDKGVDDKDVKTTSYSLSPKYANPQPCYSGYCTYSEQRVIGYQVNQTTEVKVRDTAKIGDLLTALGDAGISQLYGPNFTVENTDAVTAEARKEAIDQARAKAEVLAKDLGVRLVRVVSFNENGGGPIYYGKGMGGVAMDAVAPQAAPSVPTGENETVVDVSITYEIR